MKPVKVSARGILDEPIRLIILFVIVSIAPVCLRASAIIEPSTITTPIDPKVEPKPFSNAFIKFMNGNASFIDYIKIILAMPKRIFIRCLLKI